MQTIMRFVGLLMIRIFYRTIALLGGERVPDTGPVVVVANHPNGLLDPLVARVALGKKLAFLGKSTMWNNAFGRLAMNSFGAIPVYRPKDGADTSKNEATFQRCRELLAERGWLMLFPEGISHSQTTLQPVKTGAARIILSAIVHAAPPRPPLQHEVVAASTPSIKILPLGMVFEDKTIFRSRATVNVGHIIDTAPYFEQARTDERAAVLALTEKIGLAVSDAMLQADDAEIWNGLLAVAAWTSEHANAPLAEITERAKRLERTYRELMVRDPGRAQALVERARRFAFVLRAVGIDNPFALEGARVLRPARLLRFTLVVTLLSPLIVAGLVASWVPYQIIRIAAKLTGDTDVISTVKAIGGIVFFPLFWLGETIFAGARFGWLAALAWVVIAPLGSWIALRVSERVHARREAIGGWWMRMNQHQLAESIAAQRHALATDVNDVLRETPASA